MMLYDYRNSTLENMLAYNIVGNTSLTLVHLRHFGLLVGLGLETGPLALIGLYNTTLLKGRLHASIFVVCWRKCLIEIKTFFQQKMLNKRHQTCMLHDLKLLIQQMFYNNV